MNNGGRMRVCCIDVCVCLCVCEAMHGLRVVSGVHAPPANQQALEGGLAAH